MPIRCFAGASATVMVSVPVELNFKTSLLITSSKPAIASATVLALGTTHKSKFMSFVSRTVFSLSSLSVVTSVLCGTLISITAAPSWETATVFISSPVPPCQWSVWNGEAGRPSLLTRFGLATFRQPKRTWVGVATSLAWTTTVSPSMVASAGTNLPSAPAISNSLSGLPSRDFSPPPTWANESRILLPSTFIDL